MLSRFTAILFAAIILPLAATASAIQTMAATPATTKPHLLYEENWASGADGWVTNGDGSFAAANGLLTYDGNGGGVFVAPLKIRKYQHFAIEARIQGYRFPVNDIYRGGYSFGIFVRANRFNLKKTGIKAGINQDQAMIWTGDTAPFCCYTQTVGGASYSPGNLWHTLRLDVRGTNYRLKIDGQLVARGTTDNFAQYARVGVFGDRADLNVGIFKVFVWR